MSAEVALRPRPLAAGHLSTRTVIRVVSERYQVTPAAICGGRRWPAIARARAVAMYLARQLTADSYPELGRAFGRKHHTTVMAAVEKVGAHLQSDPALRSEVEALLRILRPPDLVAAPAGPAPTLQLATRPTVDDDLEAFCGSCGPDGMGDWFPSSEAQVCGRCGETTCPEHRKPRQHECGEMRAVAALDREVA
jgi:hypothetical protein